jgi:molybdopterin/thiamine biosynthesis adenylyltransferase
MTMADWHAHDYHASVFQVADNRFELRWTDGINLWEEHYPLVELAVVRFAALIRVVSEDRFFKHGWDEIERAPGFTYEVEQFLAKV